MTHGEMVAEMIDILLQESPENAFYGSQFSKDYSWQRTRLRGLMNLRKPLPINPRFLVLQNRLLQDELASKQVIDVFTLPATSYPKIALVKSDITLLKCDAIVNIASRQLQGCFVPGHHCVDNCIHSAAGVELREECATLIKQQGHDEEPGFAKITKGYNLPSRFVIHTVFPTIGVRPTTKDEHDFASCYLSCLSLAQERGLKSIAFPCLSTGEHRFSSKRSADIAINTVDYYMVTHPDSPVVVFDVFTDEDFTIYQERLK
jgi:O-acetyl-ADP-ribose deacetylase (regulator of RNase III)